MKKLVLLLCFWMVACSSVPVQDPVKAVIPVKKLSLNHELMKPCIPFTTPLQSGTEAELITWVGNLVKSYSDCAILHEALITSLKEYE